MKQYDVFFRIKNTENGRIAQETTMHKIMDADNLEAVMQIANNLCKEKTRSYKTNLLTNKPVQCECVCSVTRISEILYKA